MHTLRPWAALDCLTAPNGLAVNTEDMSITINDTPRPHPPKMLHDCEAMTSEYGSGVIHIKAGGGELTLRANPGSPVRGK